MALPQGLSPAFQRMQEETPEEVISQIPEGLSPAVSDAPMDFGDRLEKIRNDRQHEIELAGQRWMTGEASSPEALVQVWGNYIGAATDVLGESVSTALASMLPDKARDFLKEWAASEGEAIAKNPVVMDLINRYENLSENDQATLGGIANIFNVGLGKSVDIGKKIKRSGVEAERDKLAESMGDMSSQGRQDRAGELGIPLEQARHTSRERDLLATLHSVKGVSMAKNSEANMKAINRELDKLNKGVQGALAKSDMRFNRKTVKNQMNLAFAEASTFDPLLNTKSLAGHRKKTMEAFNAALQEFDADNITPYQLLKLRQRFDQNMKDLFSAELFVKDGTPRKFAAPIRDELNRMITNSVDDVNVQALLNRQHKILTGKSNLQDFIASEKSLGQQALRKVEHHPVLTMGALSGGGVLANMANSEAAQLAVGGLLTGYGVMHPKTRQAFGAALQANPIPVGRAGMFYGADEEPQQ